MRLTRMVTGLALCTSVLAFAAGRYDPGASDTEIRIGQTVPLSGPVSAAGSMGPATVAYFKTVNERGGINGRKVNVLVLDDGYSPPKTVETTRKLVEDDQVLFMFGSIGTPTNASVQKYLNAKKVPQLFIGTGAERFKDPKGAPWTLSLLPSYASEGSVLGKYVLGAVAQPKIAIIHQNDDLGKDFVRGFKSALGARAASLIVSEQTFEVSDPGINSQMITAKASGANVLFYAGTQKHGAMHIRDRHAMGWSPLHLICSTASGIENVLRPAGLDASDGIVSVAYARDPADPRLKDDPEISAYLKWQQAHLPQYKPADGSVILAYMSGSLLEQVLRAAGDDLTRENVLKVSTSLSKVKVPLLIPGITVSTSPDRYHPINQFQVQKFSGGTWTYLGTPIDAD